VGFHSGFVKIIGFPFYNKQGIVGTISETGPQAVTVLFRDQPGFAVNNLDGAFRTGRDTQAATITALIIYFDDISFDS